MNVSLTPELEGLVNAKVESGLYSSASEVVRAGLRLLQQHDEMYQRKLLLLQDEIDKGLKSAESGKVHKAASVIADLRKR